MRKKRKHYSAEEKVAIIRRHLVDQVPVAQLCDELDLQPSLYYLWQKQFFEQGAVVFARSDKRAEAAKDRRISQLEDKIQLKNEVVAELMEEHVQLKKELGEP